MSNLVKTEDRIKAFIDSPKTAFSIQGQCGSRALRAAALAIAVDFDQAEIAAYNHLQYYNTTKCNPPWSEKEIKHALNRAFTHKERNPHKVGSLLNALSNNAQSASRKRSDKPNTKGSKTVLQKNKINRPSRMIIEYPAEIQESGSLGIGKSVKVDASLHSPEHGENACEEADFSAIPAETELEESKIPPENTQKSAEGGLDCPHLIAKYGSKKAFLEVFNAGIRAFKLEKGIFPHVVYLPESIARELPVRFPPKHPECLVFPCNHAETMRFEMISEAKFLSLFYSAKESASQ